MLLTPPLSVLLGTEQLLVEGLDGWVDLTSQAPPNLLNRCQEHGEAQSLGLCPSPCTRWGWGQSPHRETDMSRWAIREAQSSPLLWSASLKHQS